MQWGLCVEASHLQKVPRSSVAGRARAVMGDRLRRWIFWSILFALLPFAGAFTLNFLSGSTEPLIRSVLGSGQLLTTSVAILAASVKDMSNRKLLLAKPSLSDSMNAVAIALMLFMTASYAVISSLAIKGSLATEKQEAISWYSIWFLTASLIVAGIGIATTDTAGAAKTGAP